MAPPLLLQGGHVLLFDAASTPSDPRITFKVKDILVQGTKIVKIEDSIPVPPEATVIDARDHIVAPGFIDTHRHLWQAAARGIIKPAAMGDQTLLEYMCSLRRVHEHLWTAEDMYWGQLAGACEALSSGITTILDHSHAPLSAEHVLRTVDATRESGVRCVYAYSKVDPRAWVDWQTKQIREIGRTLQASEDKRVTLGFGYDGIAWESPEDVKSALATAQEAGSSLTTLHAVPTHMPRSLTEIHGSTDALSSAFVFSHFNHPDPADVALVKKLGASVACTPETELAMGHGYCAAFSCAANGIKAGLGVDGHAVCSGDMFAQMRLALQSARSIRNASLYLGTADGLLPDANTKPARRIPRSLVHTTAHVVRFATLGGAETLSMADRIGSLEVGKLADISLISLSSPNMLGITPDDEALTAALVVFANTSDVKTVVINGEVVKQDGELKRVQWSDVVVKFREHQRELTGKFKQVAAAADWDLVFEETRKMWGLGPEQIA